MAGGLLFLGMIDAGWRRSRRYAASLVPESLMDELRKIEDHFKTEFKRSSSKPSFGVQKGKLENEDEYRLYLENIGLKHITADEVIRPHRNIRNGVKNCLPPKFYWRRIRKTLQVADALREELGVPLKMINSAYRCPDYNSACQGAVSNSYHTRNMALDLMFACSPLDAARAAKKLRSEGVFKGGIGVYSTFIHIDTRGRNANWGMSV